MTRWCLLLALAASLALPAHAAFGAGAPTTRPGTLVVALSLGSSSLQAGALRDGEVVVAKGFEVELAKALARRLGLGRVTFVNTSRSSMTSPGPKRWDVALAQLQRRGAGVDYSLPYLAAGQAVLARRGLARPDDLAALRRLQLCAERGTSSASVLRGRVRPALAPLLAPSADAVVRRVGTGSCDAALVDVTRLADALAAGGSLLGGVAGRIETGGSYVAALERGSPLRRHVDRALRALAADGTLARLRRDWLGIDPLRAPALR